MYKGMHNSICVHHHTGLGDHMNCCGMIRYLAQDLESVHVIVKEKFFNIVEYMYRNDDNIILAPIPSDPWENEREFAKEYFINSGCDKFLTVGHKFFPWQLTEFLMKHNPFEIFYDQLGMDISIRHEFCGFVPNPEEEERVYQKLNPNNSPYVFIHEDQQRQILVDQTVIREDLARIGNDTTENPLFLAKIIANAEEVHCVSSSILCMIDAMGMKLKQKGFMHQYREQFGVGKGWTLDWNIIYPNRNRLASLKG